MTIWLLMMTVVILMLIGMALDLWRAVSAERGLATATDAAAAAGANGIDEAHYRATDEIRLDPSRAQDLATEAMDAQREAASLTAFDVTVAAQRITVRSEMAVELTLLRLVTSGPLLIRATSTAGPQQP
jgi:Flp pilus assembly protein TadG